MGFGHRVYKNYDPRARIIKSAADEVFEVTGRNPLLDIAMELERIALEDEYFVKRKLYPNVDFYSGIIYEAMGMPVGMFPVLFAIPRTSGWLAQWAEMLEDGAEDRPPAADLHRRADARLPAGRPAVGRHLRGGWPHLCAGTRVSSNLQPCSSPSPTAHASAYARSCRRTSGSSWTGCAG